MRIRVDLDIKDELIDGLIREAILWGFRPRDPDRWTEADRKDAIRLAIRIRAELG